MSQDISLIRKELENHMEVKLPYEFPQKCHIKYITHNHKKDMELFYKGGHFLSFGNNSIRIKNKAREWNVPIHLFHKDGRIKYTSHFYVPDDTSHDSTCEENNLELQLIIANQQSIIEKITTSLGKLELQKSYLVDEKTQYEELLEKNRHHLKDLSIENREKDHKLKQYEEVIQRLTNSHPLFN
jgi:hypothetical protein